LQHGAEDESNENVSGSPENINGYRYTLEIELSIAVL
jgi:hypothetical protein